MKKIRVAELFAGIGGFRLAMENASDDFDFVFSNQWDPNKKQFAHKCYEQNFGVDSCINKDINTVEIKDIADFDFLVAGFPCQDYSVAKSNNSSKGIEGKKGVLWWNIYNILKVKKPKYILLENVDRLLKSPAKQRGKDFAIILNCLNSLGYNVEWRVFNAGEHGFPQKRKRVFIFASKTKKKPLLTVYEATSTKKETFSISNNIYDINNQENEYEFLNYGTCCDFNVTTFKIKTNEIKHKKLKDLVLPLKDVDKSFFVEDDKLKKWQDLKSNKRIERNKVIDGKNIKYIYSQGNMDFPDSLDKPARTILTSEGGITPSRTKHIIKQGNVFRRLMPLEIERIMTFPDNFTKGLRDNERAFVLGNAIIVGLVSDIMKEIINKI